MTQELPTLAHILANAVAERLAYYDGNRTKTAWSLGVNIRTLRNWINGKKLGTKGQDKYQTALKKTLSKSLSIH